MATKKPKPKTLKPPTRSKRRVAPTTRRADALSPDEPDPEPSWPASGHSTYSLSEDQFGPGGEADLYTGEPAE